MVSVCLPSRNTYLGFSYLGRGVSLHCCSSKAQPLLLTLDERYLLTTASHDLERGIASLGPPAPTQPPLLGCGVAPPGRRPWPRTWGNSSWPLPLGHGVLLASAPDLGRVIALLSHTMCTGHSRPCYVDMSICITDSLCCTTETNSTL